MTTQQLINAMLHDFWESGDYSVGDKLPTGRELTQRYQVSCSTLSKAMELLAGEGRLTKQRGRGIHIASLSNKPQLAGQKQQRHIGFVVGNLENTLPYEIFKGIDYVGREQNCFFEVANNTENILQERRQIRQMMERGAQGIVLYPAVKRPPNEEYLATGFRDLPIVVVDLYDAAMNRPHVIFDNWSAGREMTRHLLKLGRREIAFVKFDNAIPYRSLDDRLAGYKRALDEFKIPHDPARTFAIPIEMTGKKNHAMAAAAAVDRLLELQPQPDAIIMPTDHYARACIEYLRQKGVAVPGEITVVGFDNLQKEGWDEKFSTTSPDFEMMGERAAQMLLERIESRNTDPTGLILPCPLIVPKDIPPTPQHANQ
ncbi:MAG: GntR family transcriptional regulator [Verrucomicrobiae bacterium]|nr:GntR family transcriptional regulator [Verrucomicrobiae bacterium]